MKSIGFVLILLGLGEFYLGEIVIGAFLFFIGGLIARTLSFSLRSSGVLLFASSTAVGLHDGFSAGVIFLMCLGAFLACFRSSRSRSDAADWGIDLGSIDFGSDSDGGFGGD
ncbi:Uncharacterised protein [BD1-7 clade bacterium]|uniref:Uncharacterized protein n=1 Tax=BD1-7 clade bacterium TaxID=2029982 RepID=A0A5S9P2N3_9GAMM|nr:Uncharacterised protein [BD1-7 clade bacterium]CAA0109820.1 Uncharacterised protein [BD1-7 clade bacterium]CAA0116683.1 Uncharacterised protein [BD1-7 clade bacterium]